MEQLKRGGLSTLEIPGEPAGPTFIIFHGFGADAYDLSSLHSLYEGAPKAHWIFPQGPLEIPFSPHYTGRAWFPIDIEGIQKAMRKEDLASVVQAFPTDLTEVREKVEMLIAELNIPRSKMIFGGFSQGAILAVDIALHSLTRSAGLLLFSGIAIHAERWKKLLPSHRGTPFFQSHGREDPLLPFSQAQALERLLVEGGFQGKLHAFQGGHEIPSPILREASTFLKLSLDRGLA